MEFANSLARRFIIDDAFLDTAAHLRAKFTGFMDVKRERERYYLLPGMGGSNLRRKRKLILQWSLAAGLVVSVVVACVLYWMSTQ
jgi:hypothetical protein